MDDMTTRQVPWDQLDDLVPDGHRRILADDARLPEDRIREQWPAILAEKGRIEPAERRDQLIEAEADAPRQTSPVR